MSLQILAQKSIHVIDRKEQKAIKGGTTDWVIIEDLTIM